MISINEKDDINICPYQIRYLNQDIQTSNIYLTLLNLFTNLISGRKKETVYILMLAQISFDISIFLFLPLLPL